jgi:hypothetical protein
MSLNLAMFSREIISSCCARVGYSPDPPFPSGRTALPAFLRLLTMVDTMPNLRSILWTACNFGMSDWDSLTLTPLLRVPCTEPSASNNPRRKPL